MNRKNVLRNCACALLPILMTLAACGGGGGKPLLEPENPPPELVKAAIVRTPSPVFRGDNDLIRITRIDGKEPTFLETKAVVEPGQHTFQVSLELHHQGSSPRRGYTTKVDTSLTFAVQADHEYVIDAVEDENGVWLWATDITDGAVVFGEPPKNLPAGERIRPQWEKKGMPEPGAK